MSLYEICSKIYSDSLLKTKRDGENLFGPPNISDKQIRALHIPLDMEPEF